MVADRKSCHLMSCQTLEGEALGQPRRKSVEIQAGRSVAEHTAKHRRSIKSMKSIRPIRPIRSIKPISSLALLALLGLLALLAD